MSKLYKYLGFERFQKIFHNITILKWLFENNNILYEIFFLKIFKLSIFRKIKSSEYYKINFFYISIIN